VGPIRDGALPLVDQSEMKCLEQYYYGDVTHIRRGISEANCSSLSQQTMSSVARAPSRYSTPVMFSTFKLDCKAAALEFVGTTFFLLLGLGGIQAANSEAESSGTTIGHVMYIATSMGFSLLVSAWLFYRVTGGLFNPNITLALFLVGVINPIRFVLFCIAQLVGSIAASALLLALTPGPLAVK